MGLTLSPLLCQTVSHNAGNQSEGLVHKSQKERLQLPIAHFAGHLMLLMAGGNHSSLLQTSSLVDCVEKHQGEK